MKQHPPRPTVCDTFSYLEFRNGSFKLVEAIALNDVFEQVRAIKNKSIVSASGLCVIIEDISHDVAAQFASLLGIEPRFFQNHLFTNSSHRLDARARRKTKPSIPSSSYSANAVHLYYKSILELDSHTSPMSYELRVQSNAERHVRQMPPLRGRRVLIADACLSIVKATLGGGVWISMHTP
jgi:hypothetical protein